MEEDLYKIYSDKYGNRTPNRYLEFIFEDIDFKGKKMLDIGGGSGFLSLYGVSKGLDLAVCLEPESSGSSRDQCSIIDMLSRDVTKLLHKNSTFQDYDDDTDFDIIILHNSINHLDEEAYVNLEKDPNSERVYSDIFKKLSKISAPHSKLIIADCDKKNFFPRFGIKNPFAPTIEWHKHQSPELLEKLLHQYGFLKIKLDWLTPFNYFGELKNFKLNKTFSYFYHSYFRLIMES